MTMYSKHVVVPQPVELRDVRTGKRLQRAILDPPPGPGERTTFEDIPPVTMHSFMVEICNDQRIGKGGDGARRINRLLEAFRDKKAGAIVGIEDADFTAVMQIIDDFQLQSPVLLAQHVPLLEAWENAKKQNAEWYRKYTKNGAKAPDEKQA